MTPALILKPLWHNGHCTYSAKFRKMSSDERAEVERLADEAGFIRGDGSWTPPRTAEGRATFHRSLRESGYALKYDDPEDGPFDLQRLHLSTLTRMRLKSLQGFELDHLSGWTPVQAEGTLDCRYFYFRARGSYWRFEWGGNESRTRSPRWWYEESWPTVTGFEAGYMSDEEAICCILKAIDAFRSGDNKRFIPGHPDYERTVLDGWSAGAITLRIVCIRLGLPGLEIVRRAETLGVEVPYTAKYELQHIERHPVRRWKPMR